MGGGKIRALKDSTTPEYDWWSAGTAMRNQPQTAIREAQLRVVALHILPTVYDIHYLGLNIVLHP
jgi:hypothetical protein